MTFDLDGPVNSDEMTHGEQFFDLLKQRCIKDVMQRIRMLVESVEENSMSEGRVAACGQNASRNREPFAVAESQVIAQRGGTAVTARAEELRFQRQVILFASVSIVRSEMPSVIRVA